MTVWEIGMQVRWIYMTVKVDRGHADSPQIASAAEHRVAGNQQQSICDIYAYIVFMD